jgi:pyruvate/2-oxoglutarate dehydrogenase complex dihydrolipoamide dehydrogenase (E3) component
LNVGCVPSKALLRAAHAIGELKVRKWWDFTKEKKKQNLDFKVVSSLILNDSFKRMKELGIEVEGYKVNFSAIMERMRKLRSELSRNDSVQRFSYDLGVDVYIGHAKFTSKINIT